MSGWVSPRTRFAVGQGALVQRHGLGQPPGRLVGGGEVVAGAQGVRVGLAQDPLAVGDQGLAVLDGLDETVARARSGTRSPSCAARK